ncbi:MAG: hypothetical protein Q7S87_09995 [Agitococcus sp.]|nr:hypothetical protein [Agitococcus sp.]
MAITGFKKNCVGTICFDAQFSGMRKAQDFIVYPIPNASSEIKIQSDTRIGKIDLITGTVTLSPPRTGGSYNIHLALANPVATLTAEDLLILKAHLLSMARGKSGNCGVTVDNTGALDVFEQGHPPAM